MIEEHINTLKEIITLDRHLTNNESEPSIIFIISQGHSILQDYLKLEIVFAHSMAQNVT